MFTADMISDIADSVMRLQQKENTAVPLLQKRLDELEEQKERLEVDILREGIQQNILSREQVILWLQKMKRLDLTNDDNKRRLVDNFVNSVYLYEDRAVVSFNCREGASTLAIPCDGASACALLGEPLNP
ncbi:MAG: hypothetical protein LKF32_04485 [Mageeibacillus sp.]|jgi:hypothetical protein|nr:hypothetical protein [Mageeibacillus sp.]